MCPRLHGPACSPDCPSLADIATHPDARQLCIARFGSTGLADLTLPEGTGVIRIQLFCACEWLPEDTANTFAAASTLRRAQLEKAAITGTAVPARQKELLVRTDV